MDSILEIAERCSKAPDGLDELRKALPCDVSRADASGMTPLHKAVMKDHPEMARLLLEAKADPLNGNLMDGRTDGSGCPLSLALFYGKAKICPELIDLLTAELKEPRNLREAAALGRPLTSFLEDGLHPTAYQRLGFYRPLEAFPERSMSPDRQLVLDEALCWAARNEQLDAMKQLVEVGAKVNSNPFRGTPLLWACFSDSTVAAAWLLEHEADPNLKHDFGGAAHSSGSTAMHLAAQYSSLNCLKLLLERRADANIKDDAFRATPVGWAQHASAQDSLEILAKYGYKP